MTCIVIPRGSTRLGYGSKYYLNPDIALYRLGTHFTVHGTHKQLAATAVPAPEPAAGKKHPLIIHLEPEDTFQLLGREWKLLQDPEAPARAIVTPVNRHQPQKAVA